MAAWHGVTPIQLAMASLLPVALAGMASFETRHSTPATGVVREWASLLLILAAYGELQWFATSYSVQWETRLESWDSSLLSMLAPAPNVLTRFSAGIIQASYALLYALPPIYLGILYLTGQRARAGHYLFTLFLGTFTAYLLLPHFPVRAPRIAFPYLLVPGVITLWGKWNLYLLDRFDISTSVFPSGHVAVAFSAAFGMLRAVPAKKLIWMSAFFLATCVWAATIYCRYHYAADGAASFLISIAAWRLSGRWDPYGLDS